MMFNVDPIRYCCRIVEYSITVGSLLLFSQRGLYTFKNDEQSKCNNHVIMLVLDRGVFRNGFFRTFYRRGFFHSGFCISVVYFKGSFHGRNNGIK